MNASIPPLSLWSASTVMPTWQPLSANLTVEVCVIGGGLAGLTTAYLLAKEGVSVVVVEARELGSGETAHTTAHIAVPDDRYSHIEKASGAQAAKIVAESFAASIDLIESIVRAEHIECDFERLDGFLISCAEDPATALRAELDASLRVGVPAALEGSTPFAGWSAGPALRFANQAQFHPLRYVAGLARCIHTRGGQIYTHTRAVEITERNGGVLITTGTGRISADHVVVATNTPFHDRVVLHTKQAAYQTYAIAASVRRGALPRALMWDDADAYHYVRLASGATEEEESLIVGGEDHKTGQEVDPMQRYAALESWLREHFPQAGPVTHRWSGQVMEPLDGIAYLGRNPGSDCVYVITGDSGNGMTHATIGAILVSDLILGRPNAWLATYDPARKSFKESVEFIKEQANTVAQYADWVSSGDVLDVDAIEKGDGAVIREGLKKLAVYRDEDGSLHARSATCPHLGCIVRWNAAEKTWDCPCHGSRFTKYGSVLHGPAVTGLAVADAPDSDGETRAPKHASKTEPRRTPF
jgi:glycine/D-amino acid oxidase-like deaminating enzyme/nitrite reductase/ring-hydroxylating ferredoxin subunit